LGLAHRLPDDGHAWDWCKGHASSLEQAQVEAEHAYTRIRDSLSQADYDDALWKKNGKARGLN
jgi:hypothetical protein